MSLVSVKVTQAALVGGSSTPTVPQVQYALVMTPGAPGPAGSQGATGPGGSPGATGATGAQGPIGPPAANFKGIWAVGTTYQLGDWVTGSDTLPYVSVIAGNVGHQPVGDDLTHWQPWLPASTLFSTSADALIPPHVDLNAVKVDMCRAWGAFAAVLPGQDITAKAQAIANFAQSNGTGARIYFSQPGTYLLNGPRQSGTAFGVNYSGQILLPAQLEANATIPICFEGCGPTSSKGGDSAPNNSVTIQSNLASPAPQTATMTIATPAVVAAGGVVLGDAVSFTTTGALPTGLTAGTTYYVVSIVDSTHFELSATPGGSAINTTGTQSGTHTMTLQSACAFVSVIPAYIGGSGGFSNITAITEDITWLSTATDPQFYGLDFWSSAKARLERGQVLTSGEQISGGPYTGSGVGVRMPGLSNAGMSTMRDFVISGFPTALMPGEHGNYEGYITCAFAHAAIRGNGGGIPNWFANVNVRGCDEMFAADNTGQHCILIGNFHMELDQASGSLLVNDPANALHGRVAVSVLPVPLGGVGGSLPQIGGLSLDVQIIPDNQGTAFNQAGFGRGFGPPGWMGLHPVDNFLRASIPTVAGSIPGATCPTNHPYLVNSGTFSQVQSSDGGTCTITIASPAVITQTAHGYVVGDPVVFTTTGALPTGLVVNNATDYYVSTVVDANTFQVSATVGGSAINTTGSQSGVHTCTPVSPHGTIQSTASPGLSQALLPIARAGESRTVTAKFTTNPGGTYTCLLYAHAIIGGSNTANNVSVKLSAGNLVVNVAGAIVATVTGVISAGVTYLVDLAVTYADGVPVRARVYLNGVKVCDWWLTAAQQAGLVPNQDRIAFTYVYDGFGIGAAATGDTGSSITSFAVSPGSERADPSPVSQIAPAATAAAGVSIAPNAALGLYFPVIVSDASAFSLIAPVNPPASAISEELVVEFKNSISPSIAMGAVTFNAAAYPMAGFTFTNPGNGSKRYARFRYNGAKWVCQGVAGADYT